MRKSDKLLVRQAFFSFLAILILGSVAGGTFLLGTTKSTPVQTQVLGTEVSPTEIPSLADTITPTIQPSATPTPSVTQNK